jgi:hypothetical protein
MNEQRTVGLKFWISIQLIILLVSAYYIFNSNHENVEVLFVGIESLLIMPAGIITLYLNEVFHVYDYFLTHESFFSFVFINWVIYSIVGYIQWFVIVPKMIDKCKQNGCLLQ